MTTRVCFSVHSIAAFLLKNGSGLCCLRVRKQVARTNQGVKMCQIQCLYTKKVSLSNNTSQFQTVETTCIFFFSFAQWRYHSQWGFTEAWLLLVENYSQYPAQTTFTGRLVQFFTAPTGATAFYFERGIEYVQYNINVYTYFILTHNDDAMMLSCCASSCRRSASGIRDMLQECHEYKGAIQM